MRVPRNTTDDEALLVASKSGSQLDEVERVGVLAPFR
jgi:hypothetical protein